jgi:undecaprenyl-diphosphatase
MAFFSNLSRLPIPGRTIVVERWKKRSVSEVRFLIAALGICLAVWLFAEVADEVEDDEHLHVEERIMLAFRDSANPEEPAGPPWLKQMAIDISALGGATVIIMMSMLVCGHMMIRGRWRRVIILGFTIAGGHLLSHTLKTVYGRERPDIVPHLAHVDSASFPSGHSLSSSVIYLTMGALLAQAAPRRREKIYLISIAFGLTFVIGLSRVFLGVHYPSDVLAGWSAGTAWALVCWLIANHFRGRGGEPPKAPTEKVTVPA